MKRFIVSLFGIGVNFGLLGFVFGFFTRTEKYSSLVLNIAFLLMVPVIIVGSLNYVSKK